MNKLTIAGIISLFLFIPTSYAQTLPGISDKLGNAVVYTKDDSLVVNTGLIERKWLWTGKGLVTTYIKDLSNNRKYSDTQKNIKCDWNLKKDDLTPSEAKLVSMTVKVDDDEGFVNKHLEIVTQMKYESLKLEVQHVIWVFPGATGIRTQLRIKALPGFLPKKFPGADTTTIYYGGTLAVPGAVTEFIPLDFSVKNTRRYWGYYNDPGNRNDQSKGMLKEEVIKGFPIFQNEAINWASGIAVDYGNEGVMMIKESPKCVNQQGHNTGSFYAGPTGLSATGPGLLSSEIVADRFRECWANWTIVYSGGNEGMQLSLKQFDRIRYPIVPDRDMMTICDTWGPGDPEGDRFTKQDYLQKEIPLLADLGIDVLRLDVGWQQGKYYTKDTIRFRPHYPDGWKTIRESADKVKLKLGLWVSIKYAKTEDLIKNLDEAGVVTWKVDYDFLSNRSDFEERKSQVRAIMKHAWGKTQFAFCPEYDDPRYGWYYFREYGSMFFQNMQEGLPEHLTMVPYQVLRRHWEMCKYYNANKLQTMMQNPKRTNPQLSDGNQHSHSYCFAMSFPFIPVFFQSAQNLNAEEHKEMKSIIALYAKYRSDLFSAYTFPIGDEPDNASWSGFQMVQDPVKNGYLLIFRELHNAKEVNKMQLKFIRNQTIQLTNLESGERHQAKVDANGNVEFKINKPASYQFIKYEIVK